MQLEVLHTNAGKLLPVGDWKWLHFLYLATADPDFKVMWLLWVPHSSSCTLCERGEFCSSRWAVGMCLIHAQRASAARLGAVWC